MVDMSKMIRSYEGVISDALCDKLINAFTDGDALISGKIQSDDPTFNQLYDRVALSPDSEIGKEVFKTVDPYMFDYFDSMASDVRCATNEKSNPRYYLKRSDVCIYKVENQNIPTHSDKIVDDMYTKPHRQFIPVSCLVYLNDSYQGGELFFHNQEHLVSPKKGSLLMVPNFFLFTHEAFYTAGTRYMMKVFYRVDDTVINPHVTTGKETVSREIVCEL